MKRTLLNDPRVTAIREAKEARLRAIYARLGKIYLTPAEKRAAFPETNRAYQRAYFFKKKYGLTREAYDALRQRQNHSCVICNRHESELKKKLQVDHDHATGKVRGLLCYGCNVAIGMTRDRPDILRLCAIYLDFHAHQHEGK